MIFKKNTLDEDVRRSVKQVSFSNSLSQSSKEKIKERVMSEIVALPRGTEAMVVPLKFSYVKILLFVIVGMVFVSGTVYASSVSKPGDLLFPVKKAQENVVIRLVPSEQKKLDLKTKFAEERIHELQKISDREDIKPEKNNVDRVRAEKEISETITDLKIVKKSLEEKQETNHNQGKNIDQTIQKLEFNLEKSQQEREERHSKKDKEDIRSIREKNDKQEDFHNKAENE